jgi:hypothetical protein
MHWPWRRTRQPDSPATAPPADLPSRYSAAALNTFLAKTNVLFFTKGRPTERVWIYDARANVPKITKKSRPLTPAHFADFEACYGSDPMDAANAGRVIRQMVVGGASHSVR